MPAAVVAEVLMFIVEDAPAVIVEGVNVTVVPVGSPLEVSARVWALPVVTAVLIVLEVDWPAGIVREVGDALIEKSSGTTAVTVSVTVVVWVADAPVAVTVIG